MGQEFTDYLGHAIYICVCGVDGKGVGSWDIAKKGWPDRPKESDVIKAREWVKKQFDAVIREYGMRALYDNHNLVIDYRLETHVSSPEFLAKLYNAPSVPSFIRSPNLKSDDGSIRILQENLLGKKLANERIIFAHSKSETSYAAICEMAIRSLSDWRATLHFLAMLRYVKTVSGNRLSIGEIDRSVIDRFNVHITKNKKPNLTHQMVAQLSMSARIRIILTTNFDRLIESAFEAFGRPLSDIPVGISGGLPHPDLVHGNDCLIKLHGDCHETRADFSLDSAPSEEDKRRFFHYVRGDYPNSDSSSSHRYIPSHLLVVGYSGSDRRCNDMIKYVLDSDENAKVYWICHSKRDIERLRGNFSEDDYKNGRIIATQTERPDLLLYDIYQKLNLTLPNPGVTYNFPDRVIPARSPLPEDENFWAAESDALEIESKLSEKHQDNRGAIVVIKGESGILTVIHQTFELLRGKGKNRIWMELEDFPDAATVGAEIGIGLSVQTGSLPLGHLKPLPKAIIDRPSIKEKKRTDVVRKEIVSSWKRFFSECLQELGITPGTWTVGFYGRNGAGGCSGWDAAHETWEAEQYEELQELIRGLSAAGFNVLYAPYTVEREKRDRERLELLKKLRVSPLKSIEEYETKNGSSDNLPKAAWKEICPDKTELAITETIPGENIFSHRCRYKQPKQITFESVMRNVSANILELNSEPDGRGQLGYKSKDRDRWLAGIRALYAASLFRQSRHYSSFINDGVYRCPNQFNMVRDDNDEIRHISIQNWIDRLRLQGVFYTKPGGFAWAYRDIRLGIRNIIETLHFDPRIAKAGRFLRMQNFASGCHFYIGEWYAQAHRVTRHPMPMIEGLQHFYESIRLIKDFGSPYNGKFDGGNDGEKEPIFAQRRKSLFFGSAIALLNLLKSGESSLRYWSSVPFRRSMFSVTKSEEILEEIRKSKDFVLTKDDQESTFKYADSIIDDIRRELTYIEKRISSDYRVSDIPFQKDIPFDGSLTYEFDGNYKISGSSQDIVSKLIRSDKILSKSKIEIEFRELVAELEKKNLFCLESGILELVELIHQQRTSLFEYVNYDNRKFPRQIREKIETIHFKFLLEDKQAIANPHEINLFIQSLVEWAFLYLRRAKKMFRSRAGLLSCEKQKLTEDYQSGFLTSTVFCYMAINLCRLLPPAYAECAAKEYAKAQSIYGLALGHLGRFREAYRRLGEARVICRSMSSTDGKVLLGIAELRRAEVLCLEAREYGVVLRWFVTHIGLSKLEEGLANRAAKQQNEIDCQSLSRIFGQFFEQHDFVAPKSALPTNDEIQSLCESLSKSEASKLKELHSKAVKAQETAQKEEKIPPDRKIMMENIILRRGLFSDQRSDRNHDSPDNREIAATLNRVVQAKIGDAWRCLEESRRCFSGRTHSSRWWGRLYALELRVFGEAGLAIKHAASYDTPLEWYRMLPCRNRRDLAQHLRTIWKSGIAVAGDGNDEDRYNRLKITYIYLFALTLGNIGTRRDESALEDYLDHLRITRDELKIAAGEVLDFLVAEFSSEKIGQRLRSWLASEESIRKSVISSKKTKKQVRDLLRDRRDKISLKYIFGNDNVNLDIRFYHIVLRKALIVDFDSSINSSKSA